MLDFRSIVKFSEMEINAENKSNNANSNQVLNMVLKHIDDVTSNFPNINPEDVVDKMTLDVFEYLQKINDTQIVVSVIEYYLERKLNSTSEYNLDKAYKDICKAEKEGKLNIAKMDTSNLEYGFELDEDMKKMVILLLQDIRMAKTYAKDWLDSIWDNSNTRELLKMSSKQRKDALKRFGNTDEVIEKLENAIRVDKRSELELLRDEAKKRTETRLAKLKKECINKIVESVRILDSFGLLEEYKELANKTYRNLKLPNYQYDKDEIEYLLSPENLKKLSIEQLIATTSFWINRVNKILPDLSKSRHIVNNLLYECTVYKNGKKQIELPNEYLKAIDLKKRVLHKICFELFDGVQKIKNKGAEAQDKWVRKEIEKLCKTYGREYQKYFDELLPHIENSLEKDLLESFYYENTIYNSYKIKSCNMEAILISLLNKNLSKIENFGYIKEDNEDISTKKFVLIGIDIQGMNMPLRLHINRNSLIEILEQSQNGSTLFPIYKGMKDFNSARESFIPTHIYVPMSKEKQEQLKSDACKAKGSQRTMNTIAHLCYISCKENMPEHMKNQSGRQFIDIAGNGDELVR